MAIYLSAALHKSWFTKERRNISALITWNSATRRRNFVYTVAKKARYFQLCFCMWPWLCVVDTCFGSASDVSQCSSEAKIFLWSEFTFLAKNLRRDLIFSASDEKIGKVSPFVEIPSWWCWAWSYSWRRESYGSESEPRAQLASTQCGSSSWCKNIENAKAHPPSRASKHRLSSLRSLTLSRNLFFGWWLSTSTIRPGHVFFESSDQNYSMIISYNRWGNHTGLKKGWGVATGCCTWMAWAQIR